MSQIDVLSMVSRAKPGDHLCFFYETENEHRTILAPFLRDGLERNHKVIYATEDHTTAEILGYLEEIGCDPNPYLSKGQLQVISCENAYLREGAFDPEKMVDYLRMETERSLIEGYGALRITGETSWIMRRYPGSERFMEFEGKVNGFCSNNAYVAMCQYDRSRLPSDIVPQVLSTHPIVLSVHSTDNALLSALPRADYLRLSGYLGRVVLKQNDVLHERGDEIRYVYFPENGIISLFTTFKDGTSFHVAEVDNRGFLGLPLGLGDNVSFHRAVVQIAGTAMRMEADQFLMEFGRSELLQKMVLGYIRTLMVTISRF